MGLGFERVGFGVERPHSTMQRELHPDPAARFPFWLTSKQVKHLKSKVSVGGESFAPLATNVFPKIRGTLFGVLIIRVLLFRVLY